MGKLAESTPSFGFAFEEKVVDIYAAYCDVVRAEAIDDRDGGGSNSGSWPKGSRTAGPDAPGQ